MLCVIYKSNVYKKYVTIKLIFIRNGRMMGAAFEDIKRGSGYAYFPAVSLSYGEVIQMNFGATPFR